MEQELPVFGGRFECVRRIGSGGAADVYEAKDLRFGARCAVKVLRGRVSGASTMTERLRDEARVMGLLTRTLKHPNVLQVWDFGTDDGHDWVATELAEGGSLQDRLERDGAMPVEVAVGYTIQLLAALTAAHRLGVVHRDVKPHNVLLDGNGVALLSDFGIALLGERLFGDGSADQRRTRAGVSMGSFAYMPPEQRLDARSVGPTADIYAAGATLYALLTAGNPVDLFAAEAHSARWEGVPGPLLEVLLRATAKEPSARWPSAAAFGAALAAALGELAPEVRAAPIPQGAGGPATGPVGPPPALPEAFQRATRQAVTFVQSDELAGDRGPSSLTSEGGFMTSMSEEDGTHASAEHLPPGSGPEATAPPPSPGREPTVVPPGAPAPLRSSAARASAGPPDAAGPTLAPPGAPFAAAEAAPAVGAPSAAPLPAGPGPASPVPAGAAPAGPDPAPRGRAPWLGLGVALLLLALLFLLWDRGGGAPDLAPVEGAPTALGTAPTGADPAAIPGAPGPAPGSAAPSPGPAPASVSPTPPGGAGPAGRSATVAAPATAAAPAARTPPSAATAPPSAATAPAATGTASSSSTPPSAASRDPAEAGRLPCSPASSRSGPSGVWEGSNAGHDFTLWVCVQGTEAVAVSRDVYADGEPQTSTLRGTWVEGVLSLADEPSQLRPRTYTLALGAAGLLTGRYEVAVTGKRQSLSLARRRAGG